MQDLGIERINETPNSITFRHYIYLWLGQQTSLLGSIVVQFIITWWATITFRSALLLGIFSFIYFIPQVIITPVAGVYIDKWDKKKIIIISDTTQAFLTFLLILAFYNDMMSTFLGIFILIVVNTLRGFCQAAHYPTLNAIIPLMIERNKLSRINGANSVMSEAIQILSPFLALILLSIYGIKNALWIDIFTYFVALTSILLISIPQPPISIEKKNNRSFYDDFKEGLKTITSIQGILILILLFMFLNFFIQPIIVLFPYFITVFHEGTIFDYVFVSILFHSGFFLGGFIMIIKKKWKHHVLYIFLGVFIVMTCYLFLSLAPFRHFSYIGILFLIMGLNIPITNALFQTILQSKVPRDKLGRIFSLYIGLSWLISPIGKIISGVLADIIGIAMLFFIFSVLGCVTTLMAYNAIKTKHVDSSLNCENISNTKN